MQLFISAGNSGAGRNTVGDPSVTTDAISVGSYITRDTWLSNYGSTTEQPATTCTPFSSRGPREDGGFKPNIVAPGAAISTMPPGSRAARCRHSTHCPPGYAMFNGTSMAAPQATGAAALLVGAYKATHGGQRPNSPRCVTRSGRSAPLRPAFGAYEQGAGLFNVRRAPGTCCRPGRSRTPCTTHRRGAHGAVAVCSPTPDIGVGIHDREGVGVGTGVHRTYTLTRTTGPNVPVTLPSQLGRQRRHVLGSRKRSACR